MAVNQTNVQYAYGIGDALITLAPRPIIAQRDPTTSDFAQLGTSWINEATATAWILASITSNSASWTTSPASGSGNFTSVTVNPGDVDVTAGSVNIDAGNLNLTLGTANFGGGVVIDTGLEVNSGDVTVSTTDPIALDTTSSIGIGSLALATPINIGNIAPTSSRTVTISGGTVATAAVTDTLNLATGGATTNANSVKQVNIASGTVTTGQSVVNINSGTAASGTSTVNISTGTGGGTKAVNIGNADALTTVNVSGLINLNQNVNEDVNICAGTSTASVNIGNAASDLVSVTSASGLVVSTGGLSSFDADTDTQASPTAATTLNTNIGACTFTGFTTASAASQNFTITNSLVSATSLILCNISNEGANDAKMTVTRINRGAGSFVVTATNNGSQALNGNLTVTFWVL
jgi:hypothetical protein